MNDIPFDVPRPSEEMKRRFELADTVEAHSEMKGFEKETGINMLGDEKYYTISSYRPTIVRSVLEHSYASIQWIVTQPSKHTHNTFSSVDDVYPLDDEETVVGVGARMPIGTLTVKGSLRSNNHQSTIVSTPKDLERVEGAFDE